MDNNTIYALNNVIGGARNYIIRKYGNRKRLTQDELWERATLIRDITTIEEWIDNNNLKS